MAKQTNLVCTVGQPGDPAGEKTHVRSVQTETYVSLPEFGVLGTRLDVSKASSFGKKGQRWKKDIYIYFGSVMGSPPSYRSGL